MASKPTIAKIRKSGDRQKIVTIPHDDHDFEVGDYVEIRKVEFPK